MSGVQHYNLKKVMKRTMRLPLLEALETTALRGNFTFTEDINKAPTGPIQKAEFLEPIIKQLDKPSLDRIHAEFQWLNIMAFTPKIATNLLRELTAAGAPVDESVRSASVATLAAYTYAHVSEAAWRRLCTQTQIMQIGRNAWTTVRITGVPDTYVIDPSDEKQEEIKRQVCGFIFQTEGRAERGFCSYYIDDVRDEHVYRIVMTDHPQYKKFWVKKSIFRERNFKDVTEIVFRYDRKLGELSVCSDGDDTFDKLLCHHWRDGMFADMPDVKVIIPNKDAYHLDFIKTQSGTLDIPEGSKVTSARVIFARAESVLESGDWYAHHASRNQDIHDKLVRSWAANGSNPNHYTVKRIEIEFHYIDPFGAPMKFKCYFSKSNSDWLSLPSDAQVYVRQILENAGIVDVAA